MRWLILLLALLSNYATAQPRLYECIGVEYPASRLVVAHDPETLDTTVFNAEGRITVDTRFKGPRENRGFTAAYAVLMDDHRPIVAMFGILRRPDMEDTWLFTLYEPRTKSLFGWHCHE